MHISRDHANKINCLQIHRYACVKLCFIIIIISELIFCQFITVKHYNNNIFHYAIANVMINNSSIIRVPRYYSYTYFCTILDNMQYIITATTHKIV